MCNTQHAIRNENEQTVLINGPPCGGHYCCKLLPSPPWLLLSSQIKQKIQFCYLKSNFGSHVFSSSRCIIIVCLFHHYPEYVNLHSIFALLSLLTHTFFNRNTYRNWEMWLSLWKKDIIYEFNSRAKRIVGLSYKKVFHHVRVI